jgi:parvulin-like peptidyl-prolyl isomerase
MDLPMKAGVWIRYIVAFASAACGWWISCGMQAGQLQAALRDARFRDPQATLEAVSETLNANRRLRESRPAGFGVEIEGAVQAEFDVWQRQFEKGEMDRFGRLALQGQTGQSFKHQLHDDLLDSAWLEKQLLENATPVTDGEARAWFKQHGESLRIPARYRVAHVFLSRHDPKKPDRTAEIRALHERLTRGEADFGELALNYSEDERSKHRGGDLGWVTATRMPVDFIQAVERLEVGRISGPIETKLGWHLLRVEVHHVSRLPEFEEVRAEIIAALDQQRRTTILAKMAGG